MTDKEAKKQLCPCGSDLGPASCCLRPSIGTDGNGGGDGTSTPLIDILDALIAAYVDDHQVVFASDEERRAHHFSSEKARQRAWRQPKTCMYPRCTAKSIKQSHTIPRASLALIANDGHLMHPQFSQVSGTLEVVAKGLNQASTFAGFCEVHEREFQGFESKLRLETDTDVAMQVFRVVCREMVIKRHEEQGLSSALKEFCTLRDNWAKTKFEDEVKKRYPSSDFSVSNATISANDVVASAESALKRVAEDRACFERSFYEPFCEALATDNLELLMYRESLPERLPVALAGRGNFAVQDRMTQRIDHVIVVLNVVPVDRGTEIFICCGKEYEESLHVYLSSFLRKTHDTLGLLRMVESWMLHGSDHWFLSPSAWQALSEAEQDAVRSAILDEDRNIGSQPSVPLLNGARE